MWQSSIYTRTCPTPTRRSSPPCLSPTHGAGPGVLSTGLPSLELNAGGHVARSDGRGDIEGGFVDKHIWDFSWPVVGDEVGDRPLLSMAPSTTLMAPARIGVRCLSVGCIKYAQNPPTHPILGLEGD